MFPANECAPELVGEDDTRVDWGSYSDSDCGSDSRPDAWSSGVEDDVEEGNRRLSDPYVPAALSVEVDESPEVNAQKRWTRDAIAIIVHLGVGKIPVAHILKRWTRDARDVLPANLIMYQKDSPAMHSQTFRHGLLHVSAMESVKLGDTDLETFKEMMKHLTAGQKAVKAILDARGVPAVEEPLPNYDSSDAEWHRNQTVGYQSEPDIVNSGHMVYGVSGSSAGLTPSDISSIRAPLIVRNRGRPRVNRFLSPPGTKEEAEAFRS